jgi:hypothetical protein
VPAYRRGIAAGARPLVQNTGAVLSIAFVLAIVTSAVPKATLFAVFSGLTKGLSAQKLAPFIANMHVALWVLTATSLVGAAVCLMRPRHVTAPSPAATVTTDGPPELAPRTPALVDGALMPDRGVPAGEHNAEASPPSVPAGTR